MIKNEFTVFGDGEYSKALESATKDIDETKTGACFRNLPYNLKQTINVNLVPSKA